MDILDLTVIIPCFNAQGTIDRAVNSIFLQESLPKKIIFINDCSTDNTLNVLNNVIKNDLKLEIEIISLDTNKGASYARNLGCKRAQTKYIAFLDSDDVWHKDKLKFQVYAMEKYNIDILGGLTNTISNLDYPKINICEYDTNSIVLRKLSFISFLYKNYYSTPSVVVRKEVIQDENFSLILRYSEDFDCWRRISLKYNSYFMANSLTYSFKHPYISNTGSLSSNLTKMSFGEIQGLLLLYKKNMNLYIYILIFFALIFSILKSLRRFLQYFLRKFQ